MITDTYPSVFFCPMGDNEMITDTVNIKYSNETFEKAKDYFKDNEEKLINKYKVSSVSEVSFWGTTEGMRSVWSEMKTDDLIFFTKNGMGFVYMAKISNKFEREEAELLNKNFWNNNSNHKDLSWGLVFTLKDVRQIKISTNEMSLINGYGKRYIYRGLFKLDEKRLINFWESFPIYYFLNPEKFDKLEDNL
ncbi:hypothetical protein BW731_00560 [Vagococcus martis]|uniref:YTH domain-containing protein n=1 Tax=Vagococcus martis TaxID=1768210 RepID=A0A1V4DE80_9ENTE|nr:hypothetical protein [Vagococcus martis]OPF86795.1 hypothetical protein BW731_00560 [Vagococcus martis]